MPFSRPRIRLGAALAAIALAVSLAPLAPRPAAAAGGSGFVDMANGYRSDAGRAPVVLDSLIDQIAVERGHQLAAADALGHDFAYLERRFDDLGICWRGYGEIVAYNSSGDFSAFGTQWYNSTTHRNIMLGDYNAAGGSREQAGGRWYGVMVFVKLCAPPGAPTTSGFTDLGWSTFIDDIEWLVDQGITSGCTSTRFCPQSPVERGQMASFLERAFDLPGTPNDYFVDDDTNTHEVAINRARQADIVSGCAASRYCPINSVTRGQMASFLDRALHLPAATRDYFGDDNGAWYEGAVNRLAQAGIASGCTSSRFCADRIVTREQMAAFFHRALR